MRLRFCVGRQLIFAVAAKPRLSGSTCSHAQSPRMVRSLLAYFRVLRGFAVGRYMARCLLAASTCVATAFGELEIRHGETILFYGTSMVERLLEHGELEAWLQLGHPGKALKVRHVSWPGDEVGYQLRPDGYAEHLRSEEH